MKTNKLLKVLGVGALALSLVGCGSSNKTTIKVGSKNFTENEILAEVYALALEDAGYNVDRQFDISSSAVHTAITNDEIDVYPEYTGTAYVSILKHTDVPSADEVYETSKKEYSSKYKLTLLDKAEANDSQALIITKKASEKYNIKTISDLQKNASKIRFVSQGEFDKRSDGIPGLETVYGKFNFKSSKVYDNSLKYTILDNDEGDVIPGGPTEGQLASGKYLVLEDDKNFWPAYNVVPVVRDEVLDDTITKTLNNVQSKLTTEGLQQLNKKVDIDKEEYEDVAKEYYDSIK